jgi:glycosyltransferase involved in cell wall biosynthesis
MAAPVVLFLPARNEAGSVGAVVARSPASVHGHPVVCLVVDDGSDDETAAEARAAGACVVRQPPRGLGAAVRTGLAGALTFSPAAIAFCDADGEYAPEELARVTGPILDGRADYVVGSRFAGDIRRMHAHRRAGNRILTTTLAAIARVRLTDGQSGYRAFSADAARAAEIVHDYNYAQVLTLDLLRKGYRYTEVPISYSFRAHGRSFVRLLPYLCHVVPAVWRELRSASVLHDVCRKPGTRVCPLLEVDNGAGTERVGGCPRHDERVMRVVVREEPLTPEVQYVR